MGWKEDEERIKRLKQSNEELERQIKKNQDIAKHNFTNGLNQVIQSLAERNIKTCEQLFDYCKKIYGKQIIIPETSTQLSKSDIKKITLETQTISDHNKSCLIPVLEHIIFTGGGCAINSKEHKAAINSLDLMVDIFLDRASHESDKNLERISVKQANEFSRLKFMLENNKSNGTGNVIDIYEDEIPDEVVPYIQMKLTSHNINIQKFQELINDFTFSVTRVDMCHFFRGIKAHEIQEIAALNLELLSDLYKTRTIVLTDLSSHKQPGLLSCFTTPKKVLDFQDVYDVLVAGDQQHHYYG